jgi:hypothetical protein
MFEGWRVAQETRINPPILEAGARASRALRSEIGEPVRNGPPRGAVMRDVIPATERAADGLRGPSGQPDSPSNRVGWQTRGALTDLLQKQGEDLSRLASRFTAIAEALEATAAAYRRNENANTGLFRRAEEPW